MPTISFFYGIYILMYVNEHLPPHFHAQYQGAEAQIDIYSGKVIKGNLPRQALRLVEEWRQLHVEDLLANWHDAAKLILPKPIPPLE